MGWLEAIGGFITLVVGIVGLITYRRHKQAGRNEAILEAARREAEQGRERGKIDSDVGARSPDSLESALRVRGRPNP